MLLVYVLFKQKHNYHYSKLIILNGKYLLIYFESKQFIYFVSAYGLK